MTESLEERFRRLLTMVPYLVRHPGVSVSDDRRKGAEPVFKANPGIKILAEASTAYNAAPAQEAVTNLLFSHPEIDGVWSQGGAMTRRNVRTGERASIRPPRVDGPSPYRFNWNTPFIISNHNPRIVYLAGVNSL